MNKVRKGWSRSDPPDTKKWVAPMSLMVRFCRSQAIAGAVTRLTATLEIGASSGRLTTVHQSGKQPHQVSSSRSAFASFRDRRVETFGEPAVDRREEIAGLDALALPAQQPSKTCRHSELK